jgi:hypothetical protein
MNYTNTLGDLLMLVVRMTIFFSGILLSFQYSTRNLETTKKVVSRNGSRLA